MNHRDTIFVEDAQVLSNQHFEGEQFIMRLQAPRTAAAAQPGSFVHLQCDEQLAMRRPMSIMRADAKAGWIDMLFKAHGHGTALLGSRQVGDKISVMGPIGIPFRLSSYKPRALLIGGGVGIPPMVYLAEHMRSHPDEVQPLVLMGSEVPFPFQPRPSAIMVDGMPSQCLAAMPLLEDWGIPSRLASNAGFAGCFDGFVTDLARDWLASLTDDARDEVEIFSCGPTPMLRAVQSLADEFSLPAQISLEEYMACAVGGCAGCAVEVKTHAGPAMKRVCVDGPVFEAASVVFADVV